MEDLILHVQVSLGGSLLSVQKCFKSHVGDDSVRSSFHACTENLSGREIRASADVFSIQI